MRTSILDRSINIGFADYSTIAKATNVVQITRLVWSVFSAFATLVLQHRFWILIVCS
jgi:hypothetical protein